ncbi:hypothetical protein [Solemya velesiana gill symbiont]|uniref:hypothetical protein n=1 Tax=Solemya velesiana gill symbiont TaxID=1918948 RepID=UPI001560A3D1|nr:hypothetical protein [Solemya velesiana gill symbiont]
MQEINGTVSSIKKNVTGLQQELVLQKNLMRFLRNIAMDKLLDDEEFENNNVSMHSGGG